MRKQPKILDLSIFQELARQELARHLKFLEGSKDVFFDEELMKPFDLVSGATFLKQNGVNKIYKLQHGSMESENKQIVFIVRPYISRIRIIAEMVYSDKQKLLNRNYHILFTPKRLSACDLFLEQEGIYGEVSIAEFKLDFFQLDEDVLSLEMPLCYREIFSEHDRTCINTIARTLHTLQDTYGTTLNNYCFGSNSKAVFNLFQTMSDGQNYIPPDGPEIGSMVILDRNLDYPSLLCSQLTYEGLIAERFGIKSGIVDFSAEVTKTDKGTKLKLNSSDRVFFEIRGLHISSIFPILSHKAKLIQCGYDKRNDLDTVSEMKQYVSEDLKLLRKDHSSLAAHIGAGEVIMSKWKAEYFDETLYNEQCLLYGVDFRDSTSFVETCINKQDSALNSLRLLCLLSVCRGGLDGKLFKSLKQQYLQSYGYRALLTFKRLKNAGLYTESTDRQNLFPKVKKKFNLIPKSPETVNLTSPTDMSYVFGGSYTPFLVKLVELVSTKGLNAQLEEQVISVGIESHKYFHGTTARKNMKSNSSSETILVVFLGGCTHTEINALRFIGTQLGYRFIIVTTAVVTAMEVLQTLC